MMQALWDDESFVDDNTLTVNVNGCEKALRDRAEDCIKTVKGEGIGGMRMGNYLKKGGFLWISFLAFLFAWMVYRLTTA
jgi:hypothetical protein